MKNLKTLQDNWESGSELIVQFDIAGTIHRVIKTREGYNLLRYFTIGTHWSVSVDEENMNAETAMQKIAWSLI